jgi:integrase
MPYREAEIAAFFALADTQPTPARLHRLGALLCLGLGAGLTGEDLRHLTGGHLQYRAGGLVVVVEGRRARVVPVLGCYHHRLMEAARFAGDGYLIGGVEPGRRNVTNRLVSTLAGGVDLPALELSRLRATWLATQAAALGLPALFRAAGFGWSQQLGDLVALLPAPSDDAVVGLLGGSG